MISLPTELWINVFENIESITSLWEFRFVSHKLRSAALFVLKNRVKSDINLRFTAIIDNTHTKEFDSFLFRPKSLSEYSLESINIGAKGLSNKMSAACHQLQLKNQNPLKAIDQVFAFVQDACTQLEKAMPRGTLAAYNSIFR